MTPGAIAASIAALLGGRVRTATGPRALTVTGALLMAASGLLLAATLPRHPDFLGYWLPIGLVLGTGMGFVTTGTSAAAALSLPPTAFAAGTGLNQTARQIGGALGIATLATLIRSGTAGDLATFQHVYVFCALAVLGAAVVGLGLRLRPLAAPASTEADDPYLVTSAGAGADAGSLGYKRFVAVGDSMAEGVGDPTPGYRHVSWAERVAEAIGGEYLNLGKRNLLAAEVRATQLERAVAFRPDLAAVLCGGNDLMRRGADVGAIEREVERTVAALRAVGADVIMMAPFDITRTDLVPEEFKPRWHSLIEQMSALAERVALRHDAVLVDFREHPAGADPSIYSADRIHLNARGHAICAAHTLNVLRRRLAEPAPTPAREAA
jgi:lysophospholipase L1-like esterase